MIEFTVGRESGVENPRLAVTFEGKTVYFGNPGSVPKEVSRHHCKITIDENNKVTIEDLTEDNFFFVNGIDCKRKGNVDLTDTIELGPTKYKLDLETIFAAFSSKQSYDISHLEEVYDNFEKDKFKYQVKQGRFAALSSIPIALSMLSGLIAFVYEDPLVKKILVGVAFSLLVLFAVVRFVNADKNPRLLKQREDAFREKYVCPNPACRHFLGATPYKELVKNKNCPYCKAKFTVKK